MVAAIDIRELETVLLLYFNRPIEWLDGWSGNIDTLSARFPEWGTHKKVHWTNCEATFTAARKLPTIAGTPQVCSSTKPPPGGGEQRRHEH